jgi:hypothetical protein
MIRHHVRYVWDCRSFINRPRQTTRTCKNRCLSEAVVAKLLDLKGPGTVSGSGLSCSQSPQGR